MEFIYCSFVLLGASIFTALTAKYPLTNLPWIKILRNPGHFGEASIGHKRLYIYLAVWVLIAQIFSFLFVFVLHNLAFPVQVLYENIGYDNPAAGTAGLITTSVFCLASYMFFVNKSKTVVKRESNNFPVLLLDEDNESAPDENSSEVFSSAGVIPKTWKEYTSAVFSSCFYAVPKLFASVYRYFILETDHLVEGCADYLIIKYGPDRIKTFFVHHLEKYPNRQFIELNKRLVDKEYSEPKKSGILLFNKIERRGYHSTQRFINSTLAQIQNDPRDDGPDRPDRVTVVKSKPVTYFTNGKKRLGQIKQFSVDGSGVFLASKGTAMKNESVKFDTPVGQFSGRIAHKNMYILDRKQYSGCGVEITGNENRKQCLKFLASEVS